MRLFPFLFSTFVFVMNIDILTPEQQATLLAVIDESEKIVVIGHKSPDGDALGSCLAWAGYLRTQYDKDVTVVVPDAYPDFLHWLPESHTIVRFDKHEDDVKALLADSDLIFCLDLNTASRMESLQYPVLESKARKVMIDHHLGPDMDTVLTISHPEMCATCELVFRIVWQLGHFENMERKWAEQVYCGMMTDTGGFTFNSIRPEIFFIICQLLTKEIDKDKIYRSVFHNYSSWAIRMRGYIMAQKLNVFEDLHASYFSISRMEMEDYHYIKGDAEGLVNEPLRIKGMKLSISLREDDRQDDLVWVSLRSVDDFPCNEMAARYFNGGGHKNASGGRLNCNIEEAKKIAKEAIFAYADLLR